MCKNQKITLLTNWLTFVHLPSYNFRFNLSGDIINKQLPSVDITGIFGSQVKEACEITRDTVRCNANSRYRRLDGQCNNLRNPRWGSAMNCQPRLLPANYEGKNLHYYLDYKWRFLKVNRLIAFNWRLHVIFLCQISLNSDAMFSVCCVVFPLPTSN